MTPAINFPFSAIVGQDDLKTALLVCGVNPGLGGVLIRGDKGTAKSTAARALADILPPIARVAGCAFNCAPGASHADCAACAAPHAAVAPGRVPFVTLPLGATEDRVLGSLDLERALAGAKRVFQPGLLAAAHRGILYIDEVNLLPDHLVDVLLDVAAMGTNTVEREGLSVSHPARFTLIGTMNAEEGDLRPQLLDRFGLMVDVASSRDKRERAEVVRRRVKFESDQAAYAARWCAEQDALRAKLGKAQALLPAVVLADELLELISHLCCEFEVGSLRADIVMHQAARTLAALAGRSRATVDDVRRAARLVLPHRRRRKPFEQPGLDEERLDELTRDASPPPPDGAAEAASADDVAPPESEDDDAASEQVFAAAPVGAVRPLRVEAQRAANGAGRRSKATGTARGPVVRAVPDPAPTSLALGATLRAAGLRDGDGFRVTRDDLHQQVRAGKTANLIMLIVDASNSVSVQRRMEAVKGAVLALLTDAYQRRDEVALITFRGQSAQLALPPTRSVDLAARSLRELPTGGRTPLPHALELALSMLASTRESAGSLTPLVVLLSDGKANVPLNATGDPWQQTLALAEALGARDVPALVVDTETGFLKLGRARQLAGALGAEYLALEELSADNLALTIRARTSAS